MHFHGESNGNKLTNTPQSPNPASLTWTRSNGASWRSLPSPASKTTHPMRRYCATSLGERIEWRCSAVERDEWLMRPDERRLMMR